MLEPKETVLSESGRVIGRLTYDYGKQGQPIYSGTKLSGTKGEEYSFGAYSQFDAYRRVVGQNGEAAVPSNQQEISERYTKIFGNENTAVAAGRSARASIPSWIPVDRPTGNVFASITTGNRPSPGIPVLLIPISMAANIRTISCRLLNP